MSEMGRFVQEVQEIVFNNFDRPLDEIKEDIKQRYSDQSPFILNYILREVEYQYQNMKQE